MYLSKTEAAVLPTTLVVGSRPAPVAPRRRIWPLLGPAFVAAVAYVDPGNVATNFSGGAAFGYTLLWVIVAANLMAMLIQSLTAKLGLATGRDLATLCRERLPRPVTWGLWAQAEAVAIATDLAEIVGGAVALNLLFGVPLPVGGLITAVVAFVLLAAQSRGHRPFERVIAGLLLVIGLGFGYTLVGSGIDVGGAAAGMVPSFDGAESVVLATGILGATVMPHVIYVHSVLARRLITLAPALAVLVLGGDPTTALVWSQVVLSFGIPFALVPLLWLTSRRDLMAGRVNRRITTVAGGGVAALIIALNGHLFVDLLLASGCSSLRGTTEHTQQGSASALRVRATADPRT